MEKIGETEWQKEETEEKIKGFSLSIHDGQTAAKICTPKLPF